MNRIKEERAKSFNHLTELVESGYYNHLNWSQPTLVAPNDLVKMKPSTNNSSIGGQIQFVQENVIASIELSKKAIILVFASAKNPGGGVKQGSKAQEEEIALHSSWYFQAKLAKDFYLEKGASAINTDNMIHIEKSYLLKNEYGKYITPISISLIGATAPNVNGMISQSKKQSDIKIEAIMAQRIENVLKLAQMHKKQELILGAWGCGVFGLDKPVVARLFKEKIQENWFMGKIKFSIMDKETFSIFKNIILDENNVKNKSAKTQI